MSFTIALSGDFLAPGGELAFPDLDLDRLRRRGCRVVFLDKRDRIEPADVADVDVLVLLLPRFDRESIPRGGRLSLVVRYGAGIDNVDVEACTEAGIAVANTPEAVSRPMGVAVLTLILALTGNLMVKNAIGHRPSDWPQRTRHNGFGLHGRTLGSLGFGLIAREMFRLAQPLGMEFIAANRSAASPHAAPLGVELVSQEELFRRSDVLVLTCPLTPETHRIVDARRLSWMKPGAWLVNVARGAVVDSAALADALAAGRLAGAALDVIEPEPPHPDDPLLALPNVIVTPHCMGWTDQLFAECGEAVVSTCLDHCDGRPPAGLLNREVLASPAMRERLAERP